MEGKSEVHIASFPGPQLSCMKVRLSSVRVTLKGCGPGNEACEVGGEQNSLRSLRSFFNSNPKFSRSSLIADVLTTVL